MEGGRELADLLLEFHFRLARVRSARAGLSRSGDIHPVVTSERAGHFLKSRNYDMLNYEEIMAFNNS